MNRFFSFFVVAATLSVFALPGCGGGTSGTSEGANSFTGLDGKRMIGSLGAPDLTRMCESAKNIIADSFSSGGFCSYIAVVATVQSDPPLGREECQQYESECAQWVDGLDTELRNFKCDPESLGKTNCAAPVSLFESCFLEKKEDLENFFAQASCTSPDPQIEQKFEEFLKLPQPRTPSCIQLDQLCPGDFF